MSSAPNRRPHRRPTGGSLLIVAALVIAVAMIAPSVNRLVAQQQRISALEQEIAEATELVEALETERARWDDPSYVRSQARGRLLFVQPGDTTYVVLDASGDRTPTLRVDVSVEQHVTRSDPAALYLDSLVRAANAEPEPDTPSQETP